MKNSRALDRETPSDQKSNNNRSFLRKQICDICAQKVPGPEREKIFAFGECDHYVCYVCSARLRVVCDQSDCPICRKKLNNVIFSSNKNVSYEKTSLKDYLYNEKYKIYFESRCAQIAFDKLLKYECQECRKISLQFKPVKKTANNRIPQDEPQRPKSAQESCSQDKDKHQKHGACKESLASNVNSDRHSPSVQHGTDSQKEAKKLVKLESAVSVERVEEDSKCQLAGTETKSVSFQDVFGLKKHLNDVHRLKLCDLCLTHNKLFPFEYSYYDRIALRRHMKEGELNTSHRGHPDCSLCHSTFFNTDDLLQHMSREHYHCHLCGRHDSNNFLYFLDYNSLRVHFKDKHFLCERDNCRHEQFTSAFDNRIDYQYHLVHVHGNLNSNMSRGESRQQRTITLDSAPHRANGAPSALDIRQNLPPNAAVVSTGQVATANSSRQQRPDSMQLQRQQRLPSRSEFPALGQNSTSSIVHMRSPGVSFETNFPSITQPYPGRSNVSSSSSQRLTAGPSQSFVRTLGGGYRQPEQLNEMDFPPLPEQPKVKGNKKSKTQTKSSLSRRDDYSGPLTLEQLINNSLTLSNRNNKFNVKKSSSKGASNKSSKNMKHKSLKIQLS